MTCARATFVVLVTGILLSAEIAPAAAATAFPTSVNLVGRTCDRPIQVNYDRRYRAAPPFGAHPQDEQWIDLRITPGTPDEEGERQFTATWALSDAVELCPGSWTRFGYGNREAITQRKGTAGDRVTARGPAAIKVKARFKQDIRIRSDLGPRRVRSLVAGWAKRDCSLPAGGASRVLESLLERAGARACKAPERVRPTGVDLLRHLVARFNAEGPVDDDGYGREYYRVLGQLTTYRP